MDAAQLSVVHTTVWLHNCNGLLWKISVEIRLHLLGGLRRTSQRSVVATMRFEIYGYKGPPMITATHKALGSKRIITNLANSNDVSRLPRGVVVGDRCGGRTFTDNVAAALRAS